MLSEVLTYYFRCSARKKHCIITFECRIYLKCFTLVYIHTYFTKHNNGFYFLFAISCQAVFFGTFVSLKMVDKMGTCPICYEEFCLLKVLQCNHAYCAECIKKQFLPPGANQVANTVKCSLCLRTSSILPDGKVERLKSKLFVDLCCTNCYKDKSINDSWWCSICNLTVCR